MYRPVYFDLRELAHPQIINAIGEENTWMRLDGGVLCDLDIIREKWGGPIYINKGNLDSRGLRPPNDPDGSFYSLHKQGKAFDLEPENRDFRGLYEMVIKMIELSELSHINTLEDRKFTPAWVHVAKQNHDKKPLIIRP